MNLEIGAEIIYMDQETKLELLENFPDLKKEFSELFLDKFGDRKEEEAKFWDEFWRRQREKKSILYGGFNDEDKEYRVKMPSLTDDLDKKYNLSVNQIYEEIENINVLENDDELIESFALPFAIKSEKRENSITELLNNHSKIIQSKEADLLKKIKHLNDEEKMEEKKKAQKIIKEISQRNLKILENEFKKRNFSPGKMTEEKVETRETNLFEKYSKDKVEKFKKIWSEFKSERKRRNQKAKDIRSLKLFQTNREDSIKIRSRLEAQIKRYENREVTGNEYSQDFKEKLDFLTKKIYTTNKLFYSKFPLRTDDEEGTRSVRGIANQLAMLKENVKELIAHKINLTKDEVEIKKLRGLHKTLIGMIDWNRNKTRRRK